MPLNNSRAIDCLADNFYVTININALGGGGEYSYFRVMPD